VGRNTRPKLRLSDLLPPTLPQTLPPTLPPSSPLTLHEENGSTEPQNQKKGGDYNNNNNYRDTALQKKEINTNIEFPLPDGWTDNSHLDSDSQQILDIRDENNRRVKQSELNQRKKQYEISLKSQKTRTENQDPEILKLIEILKEWKGIKKLDRPVDYKVVRSVAKKIEEYTEEQDVAGNLEGLLRRLSRTPDQFHWKNLTDFGYLDRNFNKIIAQIT